MTLKNLETRHMVIHLYAVDPDDTYIKIIGEHTLNDARALYGEAEVLSVDEARVTLLDNDYKGWVLKNGKRA